MMDKTDWGYDPSQIIFDQAEFIKRLAEIVGIEWQSANVWTRHNDLAKRIADLVDRTSQPQPKQEPVASDAYDMVDRFLRNNLHDDDYAEYSAALDSLYTTAPQPQRDDTALLRQALEALEACLGWPHVIEKLKERLK